MKAKKIVRIKPTVENIAAQVQHVHETGVRQEGKVWFQNRYWDLNRLAPAEIEYLKGFPDEFPYIR